MVDEYTPVDFSADPTLLRALPYTLENQCLSLFLVAQVGVVGEEQYARRII
jgi:hypothetical protein